MSKLDSVEYMKFPFSIGEDGARQSNRSAHIREQIEQVLFTSAKERVFRPEFGAGIVRLTFEPNNNALWELTRKRLYASLAEALKGEVDPRKLSIRVESLSEAISRGVDPNKLSVKVGDPNAGLLITIEYTLAALNHTERQELLVRAPG